MRERTMILNVLSGGFGGLLRSWLNHNPETPPVSLPGRNLQILLAKTNHPHSFTLIWSRAKEHKMKKITLVVIGIGDISNVPE